MTSAASASAPGKVILFGEHAVVYQRPAIAVPVSEVKAYASADFFASPEKPSTFIEAPDINLNSWLADLPAEHPFNILFKNLKNISQKEIPPLKIKVLSTIPIAAGLGSGAAISVAVIKAISELMDLNLSLAEISAITFEVEKCYHGTPSGIDNTVIAYAKPVYFVKDHPIEQLHVHLPFTLVIADCGISSLTKDMVTGVRERRLANQSLYDSIFDQVSALVQKARKVIESGKPESLGSLMLENHAQLYKMGVSIPLLDHLVETAVQAGAWGAKLAGAGGGGNMVAIVPEDKIDRVTVALCQAGAVRIYVSHIQPSHTDYVK